MPCTEFAAADGGSTCPRRWLLARWADASGVASDRAPWFCGMWRTWHFARHRAYFFLQFKLPDACGGRRDADSTAVCATGALLREASLLLRLRVVSKARHGAMRCGALRWGTGVGVGMRGMVRWLRRPFCRSISGTPRRGCGRGTGRVGLGTGNWARGVCSTSVHSLGWLGRAALSGRKTTPPRLGVASWQSSVTPRAMCPDPPCGVRVVRGRADEVSYHPGKHTVGFSQSSGPRVLLSSAATCAWVPAPDQEGTEHTPSPLASVASRATDAGTLQSAPLSARAAEWPSFECAAVARSPPTRGSSQSARRGSYPPPPHAESFESLSSRSRRFRHHYSLGLVKPGWSGIVLHACCVLSRDELLRLGLEGVLQTHASTPNGRRRVMSAQSSWRRGRPPLVSISSLNPVRLRVPACRCHATPSSCGRPQPRETAKPGTGPAPPRNSGAVPAKRRGRAKTISATLRPTTVCRAARRRLKRAVPPSG